MQMSSFSIYPFVQSKTVFQLLTFLMLHHTSVAFLLLVLSEILIVFEDTTSCTYQNTAKESH